VDAPTVSWDVVSAMAGNQRIIWRIEKQQINIKSIQFIFRGDQPMSRKTEVEGV
jgi:hypothetical protein